MQNNKIGMQCEKCLNKKTEGRYCSPEHSIYYRRISSQMYGKEYPFDYETLREKDGCAIVSCVVCGKKLPYDQMSIDHILPISKGGLEFDRENLQWMCLPCNLRKHNKVEDKKQRKLADSPIPPAPKVAGILG